MWFWFVVRDGVIAIITVIALSYEEAGGVAVSIVAGVLLTLLGFFAHEWGHLWGAQLAGAIVRPPRTLFSPFLFLFDLEASGTRGFLWMSYGGYLGSVLGLVVLFLPTVLGHPRLSFSIAQALALIGVLVTFALEVPATVRARRGVLPTKGPAYTKKNTQNDTATPQKQSGAERE